MTVAIIGAYQFDESGRRIAILPMAGMTLVERQARTAAVASAHPIYLLGEEDDADLAEIVTRLVRDGIDVQAVDGLPAAAEKIGLDTPVLLIADGCLADADLMTRVCEAHMPALAVVPDAADRGQYERIDALARWAGVALIDGKRVAETAAMLGSWDPVSTLLRRTAQEQATRVQVGEAPPALARDANDAEAAEDNLYDATARPPRDWIERLVLQPLEGKALPLLLTRQIGPDALADAASIAAALGAILSLGGLRWPALIALLFAAPLVGIAERLGRLHARRIRRAPIYRIVHLASGVIAAGGLGLQLALATHQWGWLLLAAVLVASMLLLDEEKGEVPPFWLPRPITLPWAMLPFAIFGRWGTGLAALTLWSAASYVAMRLRRRRAEP